GARRAPVQRAERRTRAVEDHGHRAVVRRGARSRHPAAEPREPVHQADRPPAAGVIVGALTIARHHLRRLVRSPGPIPLLCAIPLTRALIEYAAFGPTVASGKLPPIKVLVLDEDDTFLSRAVPELFTGGGPMKDMFETAAAADRGTTRNLFQRNQASALVVV